MAGVEFGSAAETVAEVDVGVEVARAGMEPAAAAVLAIYSWRYFSLTSLSPHVSSTTIGQTTKPPTHSVRLL